MIWKCKYLRTLLAGDLGLPDVHTHILPRILGWLLALDDAFKLRRIISPEFLWIIQTILVANNSNPIIAIDVYLSWRSIKYNANA